MLALRVRQEHRIGANPVRKACEFSGMVHPGFDNRVLGAVRKTEQRLRHAHVVVEISRGRCGPIAVRRSQNRRDHLRGGGFAVAARDRDDAGAEFAAVPRGDRSVGFDRVGNDELRDVGVDGARDEGCGR